jgi:hypothetical protein
MEVEAAVDDIEFDLGDVQDDHAERPIPIAFAVVSAISRSPKKIPLLPACLSDTSLMGSASHLRMISGQRMIQ